MSVVSSARLPPGWRLGALVCFLGLLGFVLIPKHPAVGDPQPQRSSSRSHQKAGINGVWVNLILDESGSMEFVRMTTIDTVNKYIDDQRKVCAQVAADSSAPNKCHVSLTKFENADVKPVFDRVLIQESPPLTTETYSPAGSTNLLDAIGVVITKIDAQLALSSDDIAARPAVLVVIMTDGAENNSWRFDASQIHEMISTRQTMGWTFVFLGANIDAWQTARTYGVNPENAFNFDVHDQGSFVSSLSNATGRYISLKSIEEQDYHSAPSAAKAAMSLKSGARGSFFSQEERDRYEYKSQ